MNYIALAADYGNVSLERQYFTGNLPKRWRSVRVLPRAFGTFEATVERVSTQDFFFSLSLFYSSLYCIQYNKTTSNLFGEPELPMTSYDLVNVMTMKLGNFFKWLVMRPGSNTGGHCPCHSFKRSHVWYYGLWE